MSELDIFNSAMDTCVQAKIATTAKVSADVTKFNAGGIVNRADWVDLVNLFDVFTSRFFSVRLEAAKLPATVGPSVVPADGTAAIPPFGTIKDQFGVTWSFGASLGGGDYAVKRDGVVMPGGSVEGLVIKAGAIWGQDSHNNWWTLDSTQKWVTSLVGPFGVVPPDLRSFNTRDGATVVFSGPNSGGYLIDMNVAKWSNAGLASNGKDFVITRNGIPFSEPGFTTKPYEGIMIRNKNGVVWIQNAAGSWVYPPI